MARRIPKPSAEDSIIYDHIRWPAETRGMIYLFVMFIIYCYWIGYARLIVLYVKLICILLIYRIKYAYDLTINLITQENSLKLKFKYRGKLYFKYLMIKIFIKINISIIF